MLLHVEVLQLWLCLGWMTGYHCSLLLIELMENLFCFHPCLMVESWRVFMVNKRDSRVLGSFNMVILTSFSIHERLVALSNCHSTVLNVCKVGFLLCSHLESDCVKLCCKNDGVLVSFYKPHLQNCLTHPTVQSPFFLVVTVINSNLVFEMVMC